MIGTFLSISMEKSSSKMISTQILAYELVLSYYFSFIQNRILFYFLSKDFNWRRPTLRLFSRVFSHEHSSSISRLQRTAISLLNGRRFPDSFTIMTWCDVIWNNEDDDRHNERPLDARARPKSACKMAISLSH